MIKRTTVSAIITCGPGLEKYVKECIDSVKAQTMPFSEIILIYDGTNCGDAYEGVTTVIRDQNKGVQRARHEGYALSTADNLMFIDADDVLSEQYLQCMVEKRLETDADIIYGSSLAWGSWHETIKEKNNWVPGPSEITWDYLFGGQSFVVSALIRREVYEEVEGFPQLPILEDWAFWVEAFKKGKTFAYSPHSTLKYRQRQKSRNRQSDELKNEIFQQIKEKNEKI